VRTLLRVGWVMLQIFLLPCLLVGLWWWASIEAQMYYLPTPQAIADAFGGFWTPERLRADVLPSIARLLIGFGLSCLLGISLGVAIGSSPRLRRLVEPVLEFLRAIPPPVLVPILLLLAGIGDRMRILVIISGCVWPILLNTVEGVRSADLVLEDTCRAYGIRGVARLRYFVLRAASPQIMTGVRLALPISIILMVISEMFANVSGLGFIIREFQTGFDIAQMWTGVVVLGLLGVVLAVLYWLVERRVLHWYHGSRPQ
jgi:ABC-type nitrate/sulfonate/bicarbonate transport system permease component